MSDQAAKSFLEQVNKDAALKAQVKGLKGEEKQVLSEIVKLGAARKLAFTPAELQSAAKAGQGKLSKQDLDKVAGGGCKVILVTVGCCTG